MKMLSKRNKNNISRITETNICIRFLRKYCQNQIPTILMQSINTNIFNIFPENITKTYKQKILLITYFYTNKILYIYEQAIVKPYYPTKTKRFC